MSDENADAVKQSFGMWKFNLEYSQETGLYVQERKLVLTGEIGKPENFNFESVDHALTILEGTEPGEDIHIVINSPGGCILEAFGIIGRIKNSPCNIITSAFGQCASAATMILMSGDFRTMNKYTSVMYHEISYGVSGKHTNISEYVAQCEADMNRIIDFYTSHSKKPKSFWAKRVGVKDWYPDIPFLLKVGAIDEIN